MRGERQESVSRGSPWVQQWELRVINVRTAPGWSNGTTTFFGQGPNLTHQSVRLETCHPRNEGQDQGEREKKAVARTLV